MISAATNSSTDVIKGKIWFGGYLIENIKTLVKNYHIGRAFWNSLKNTVVGTVLSIFICSLAGYGFQVFRTRGKDRLMTLLLLSMMVPMASIMVPLFRMFSQVHLLNTMMGFVLPSVSTAFLIFFFRQCSQTFPVEVVQAARVDGLSEFGIFFRIFFPIMVPTFAAAAIVTFMNNWNEYMWSLVVMQTQNSQTMPLLTSSMIAGYTTDYGMLMVALSIYTLPTMILFITQQRNFVSGIVGSVKG
jgi:lactose/L-arabinose transport system permease protein